MTSTGEQFNGSPLPFLKAYCRKFPTVEYFIVMTGQMHRSTPSPQVYLQMGMVEDAGST